MSPRQMLPGQMSLWQLESVLDVPRNLCLEFGQNRVGNSWDIWWVVVVVVVTGVKQSQLQVIRLKTEVWQKEQINRVFHIDWPKFWALYSGKNTSCEVYCQTPLRLADLTQHWVGRNWLRFSPFTTTKRTILKSKVFSLERLWTLKWDFGPFSLTYRVKCREC